MGYDRFYLIDGHSVMFRALFAKGPRLTSPDGEPTRGVYYFLKTLIKLCREHKPDYLCFCIDMGRQNTFRRKLYAEYKGGREDHSADPDSAIQLQRMQEIVKLLDIPIIGVPEFEADDLIASIIDACVSDEVHCVIVTRDKDMCQLVEPRVTLFDPSSDIFTDVVGVKLRFDVFPGQFVDFQTLVGDPTDNIPGVKGIGPTFASKALNEYGSLEGILENIEDLPAAKRASILNTDLKLCKSLVELRRDVPIAIEPEQLAFNGLNMKKASVLFRALGFKRFDQEVTWKTSTRKSV